MSAAYALVGCFCSPQPIWYTIALLELIISSILFFGTYNIFSNFGNGLRQLTRMLFFFALIGVNSLLFFTKSPVL